MADYRQQPSITAHVTTRNRPEQLPYRYQGTGHDTVNPEQCECGRCGHYFRYARPQKPKEE